MQKEPKDSLSVVERRFTVQLIDIIKRAMDFNMPISSNKQEQVWEVAIPYHGEMYGIDTFIESMIGDQNRQAGLLRQAFSEDSINYFLDAERNEDETPPKIILRIHLLKKTSG